ncbi:MAG TPA: 7-cyano-7-deazaguanine synthase, partial [Caulobacteraceae bacterium]|nr:7-cyano-7-deazaguanine synthase [Caulobacteraceae bacterium]
IAMAENGLPTTFVPGRNLVFLSVAAAHAYRQGIAALVGGMCETDYSGYPDCRRETLDALERTLNLGMARDISIETPLMRLTKAETWSLAKSLGGETLVELIRTESHTCYLGERTPHAWGAGCGACPACVLRARGWDEWTHAGRPAVSS